MTRPVFGIVNELAPSSASAMRSSADSRSCRPRRPPSRCPAAREELRETYAELRSIAASVDDPTVRGRLGELERRLAALSRDGTETTATRHPPFSREIDVLACAGIGATNAQIAETLALKEVTVKSYLQSAMAKLDASTRHAAVAKARRAGLLP